jgi:hypothetical protein
MGSDLGDGGRLDVCGVFLLTCGLAYCMRASLVI